MKYAFFIFAIVTIAALWVLHSKTDSVPLIGGQAVAVQRTDQSKNPQEVTMAKVTVTSEDEEKLHVLEEILASKSDNDPRLDKDFNHLSENAKELFRKRYASLPVEKRNERGTIVFLLGRNLKTAEDFRFLENVLMEPPCYNLADCKRTASYTDPDHKELGGEVTLAYPQLVSLKAIEKLMEDKVESPYATRVLETEKTSPVKIVSNFADKLIGTAKP